MQNRRFLGKNSELVKRIKKLALKKYRNIYGMYVIESKKLILEALKSDVKILKIILREDIDLDEFIVEIKNQNHKHAEDKYVGDTSEKKILEAEIREKVFYLNKEIFSNLSKLESSDGYMAILKIDDLNIQVNQRSNKEKSVDLLNLEFEKNDKIILMDRIQDPGNVGTIVRSAEAFGFNLVLSLESSDFYKLKTLRASMGSMFRLKCLNIDEKDLLRLKETHKILALDMNGKKDFPKDEKICLIVGNEGRGISNFCKEISDEVISIPMLGEVESLNAAISISIVMSKFV